MDDANRPDTARKKLGVDTNIGPRVHDDTSRRQNPFQQLLLFAISISLESAVTQPVNGKGVVIYLIANSADKRGYLHHEVAERPRQRPITLPPDFELAAAEPGNAIWDFTADECT
ncbi:MAG: hypothetical protein WBX14_12545 [Candidatus Udaeobacter sp.]